jgi:dTDP-4-dehydrorhamnose 3,5-epimerase
MKAELTKLAGVLLLHPKVFHDERGYFLESFNQEVFEKATGVSKSFVQDNHSRSIKGVLRGLHFQRPPKGQGKLVRCIQGEIWDVAVDLRPESPTLGEWTAHHLSAENHQQLWIPEGLAHGFLTLSDSAEVLYKTTQYWVPDLEATLAFDDPDIAIDWPIKNDPFLSKKDRINSYRLEKCIKLNNSIH